MLPGLGYCHHFGEFGMSKGIACVRLIAKVRGGRAGRNLRPSRSPYRATMTGPDHDDGYGLFRRYGHVLVCYYFGKLVKHSQRQKCWTGAKPLGSQLRQRKDGRFQSRFGGNPIGSHRETPTPHAGNCSCHNVTTLPTSVTQPRFEGQVNSRSSPPVGSTPPTTPFAKLQAFSVSSRAWGPHSRRRRQSGSFTV